MDTQQQRTWQWHFQRVRISFSKGKHQKVRKLAICNQELQEILGYSERIIPIADKHKASEPVKGFDRIQKHACSVYNALRRDWTCTQSCEGHQAHLNMRAEYGITHLNVVFAIANRHSARSRNQLFRYVEIVPLTESPAMTVTMNGTDISYVPQSTALAQIQKGLAERKKTVGVKQGFFSKLIHPKAHKSEEKRPIESSSSSKTVRFSASLPSVVVITPPSTPAHGQSSTTSAAASSNTLHHNSNTATPSPSPIPDLCSFLSSVDPVSGFIQDPECDRHFKLHKRSLGPGENHSSRDTLRLLTLPEVIRAYRSDVIDISRQARFEMAAHVASALLQVHSSPWLPAKWTKQDFYFLADSASSQGLYSVYPFVTSSFPHQRQQQHTSVSSQAAPMPASIGRSRGDTRRSSDLLSPPMSFKGDRSDEKEETVRACLFTVGVIILELIFGHGIEDCLFRKDYLGNDNQPNDQTDISTARRWARKVTGESGANVADAVRRCLDCSFGPRPDFGNVRFREAVYEGVVKPLAGYGRVWEAEAAY